MPAHLVSNADVLVSVADPQGTPDQEVVMNHALLTELQGLEADRGVRAAGAV